jgi:putative glutamine amidotransferase
MNKKVLAIYRDLDAARPYEKALYHAGVEPVLTPATGPISLDNAAGLLLMGGGDVNPARYGEAILPETEKPDDERDEVESALIQEAMGRDLPVLAICRGLQILNVQHGGTLVQHLASAERHVKRTQDRSIPAHAVEIVPGTLLANIVGASTLQVNSRHHQAVAKVGRGLVVTARDTEDGTIEALERPDKRFVLAVQWHPENQCPVNEQQARIFRRFGEAL